MIRPIGRLVLSLSVAVLLASALPARAVEEDLLQGVEDDAPVVTSGQVDARLEYFTWREHDGDRRLLKESGPRLRLGGSRTYNKSDITFTPRIDGTFGYVDYDGQTQGGTPVETKVRYVGFGVGADVGSVYHLKGDSSLEPYAGLGWSYWRRDLRSTSQATGYLETWDSFFARGGVRGEADLKSGSKTYRGYGELGLKLPLSTYNSAKFPGVGRVKTDPKGNVSLYGSAGLEVDRWKVGLFYDSWRFQASEVTAAADSGFGLMQPKSRADIFGLEASRAF